MAVVNPDAWTCPECGRTITAHGSDADVRCALDAVRKRHGKGHRPGPDLEHGSEVLAALGLPDPHPPARRGRGRAVART